MNDHTVKPLPVIVAIAAATPSTFVAVKSVFGSLTYTGASLFGWKVILILFFGFGIAVLAWSRKLRSIVASRLVVTITTIHIVAFAWLFYWFVGMR